MDHDETDHIEMDHVEHLQEPSPSAWRRPGEHPEVHRSGRSRSTAALLLGALAGAPLIYGAVTLGIATGRELHGTPRDATDGEGTRRMFER